MAHRILILSFFLLQFGVALAAPEVQIPSYKLQCDLQLKQETLLVKRSKSHVLNVPAMKIVDGFIAWSDAEQLNNIEINMNVDAYSGRVHVTPFFTFLSLFREGLELSNVFLPGGINYPDVRSNYPLMLMYIDHEITGYSVMIECRHSLI